MNVLKRLFPGSAWLPAKNNEEIDKVRDGCLSVGCYTAQLLAHRPRAAAEMAGGTGAKAVPLIAEWQGWKSGTGEPLDHRAIEGGRET